MEEKTIQLISEYVLLSIESLLPHEEISTKKALEISHYLSSIKKYNLKPILIDKKTGLIIDGHHRFEALKNLQVKRIPCVSCDYFKSAFITYENKINGPVLEKEIILKRAQSKNFYQSKQTYNCFLSSPEATPIHVSKLINTIDLELRELF